MLKVIDKLLSIWYFVFMKFDHEEKLAIVRIMEKVAKADSRIEEEEMQILLKVANFLDFHESQIEESKDMSMQRAGEILRGMDRDKQRFINTTLLNLMASDGNIDRLEVQTLMDAYFGNETSQ